MIVAIDPARAVDVAYRPPYVVIEGACTWSGFVAQALARHRIEGAAVAPPGR